MAIRTVTIAGVGLADTRRKSRWPARLDWIQSVSGLFIALFMWGHMFFVSSILISNDGMWTITKFFEGYFFFGRPFPVIVSFVVAGVITLIVVHAFLALRKFPINYRQFSVFRGHMKMMRHEDTTLWAWQAFTGFALFFLAAPHLYVMLTHPGMIGPFESSDRVWTGHYWPLYVLLLLAVELHGGIGLYRLAVKWGWFAGSDPNATRKRLKTLKWVLTVFFLVLGFATLAAYIKIGIAHAPNCGEPYVPASMQSVPSGVTK
jgi:fumarate reductase subunit C